MGDAAAAEAQASAEALAIQQALVNTQGIEEEVIEEAMTNDSGTIKKELDDGRQRLCYFLKECPCTSSFCKAKSWKNAAVWSFNGQVNVMERLKFHLIHSAHHYLDDQEANQICDDNINMVESYIETFAMREKARKEAEDNDASTAKWRDEERSAAKRKRTTQGGGKAKKAKCKGKGKSSTSGSSANAAVVDWSEGGWEEEATGWSEGDWSESGGINAMSGGIKRSLQDCPTLVLNELCSANMAVSVELDYATAQRFRMIVDSLERARQAAISMKAIATRQAAQLRAEADAASANAAGFESEAEVIKAAKDMILDIIRRSI